MGLEDAGPEPELEEVNDSVRNKFPGDASCWRACGGFSFHLHNEHLILGCRFRGMRTGKEEP